MLFPLKTNNSNRLFKAYVIFILSACFYLYEFVLQVAPSVMAEPMMQTFKVTAEGFGVVSAFYFYAYAPMQLPAGLLYDRYGPRKLMTIALLVCALGSIFFASTNSIVTAAIGRFLIGLGSAFSFIGVLVLISRWFPPHYFAILAGIAQLMSSLGAMFGEMPLAALIDLVNWRNASFILGGIGIVLAVLIAVVIRDYPVPPKRSPQKRSFLGEMRRLKEVCRHKYTWFTSAYAFTLWTPIAVFAVLWGVPFLKEKYHVSVLVASGMCSMIWMGIGIGSPLLGWLSDHLYSRKISLAISALLGLIATILILYVPGLSRSMAYAVLFVLGLGASGQTVSFAVVKDNNAPHLVGTASGFNNLCVLLGGAIFQPLVGVFLNRSGNWVMADHAITYPLSSYQWALLVMPICFFISLLIAVFLLRESHPENAANIKSGRNHVGKM